MNKKQQELIKETEHFVRNKLQGEGTGHDWFHIQRVLYSSRYIAKKEKGADLFIIEMTALLHDIADWKFSGGDDTAGSKAARKWLESLGLDEKSISHICEIILNLSYKGGTNTVRLKTTEGMIVQDADRLDALGAIGIARTFAYGGFKGREIYNPRIKPRKFSSFEEYKNFNNTTINHFYEKLLLLANRMNTKTGKRLALKRHRFMEKFLEEFYKEWNFGKI